MDDLGSVWMTYQESVDDLRHKLLCSAVELESVKIEAMEQMRKNEETVKNLIHLINMANKERDEAKERLQKILTKIKLIPNTHNITQNISHALNHSLSPESPLLFAANKANSSITESNSLDDSSLFDPAAASSPDSSSAAADPADAVIESLAKRRSLPQKGRLMQSVMEAGPLLTTLLVAGPLPQWRNPPPLQPFAIPAVSINAAAEPAETSRPYNSLTCSASMLSFGCGGSISPMMNSSRVLSIGSSFDDRFSMAKRQRLH